MAEKFLFSEHQRLETLLSTTGVRPWTESTNRLPEHKTGWWICW